MPQRLTNNALILAGEETVKGEGASQYDAIIAKTASSIETTSETLDATLMSNKFGADNPIPSKKVTNLNVALLTSGVNSAGETDISLFLESSCVVEAPVTGLEAYAVIPITEVPNTTSLKAGIYLGVNILATDPDNLVLVAASTDTLVVKSTDGSLPSISDELNDSSGVVATVSDTPYLVTNVYELNSDNTLRKSLSCQFWQDDMRYVTNGVQGGFTWSFTELPTFTFEGTGTYIEPTDAMTPPVLSETTCGSPLLMKNVQVIVDGITLHDKACFEQIELKSNSEHVLPTIPTVDCPATSITMVKPTLSLNFSQVLLSDLNVYSLWTENKRVDVTIKYGDETTGRNYIIQLRNAIVAEAPGKVDVNGVQNTTLMFNITKPCGSIRTSNITVINY